MKIKLTQDVVIHGDVKPAGEIIELDESLAKQLVRLGSAHSLEDGASMRKSTRDRV